MPEHEERPETAMNLVRKWWPDVLVVVGVAWLSFACSAYAGDGGVDGQLDSGGGEVSGDISIGYTSGERLNIAAASALTTIGVLAKINRRRTDPPPSDESHPHDQDRRDLRHVAPSDARLHGVRSWKSRLFDPVDDEAGVESVLKQHTDWPMKDELRLRLPDDPLGLSCRWRKIRRYLDAGGDDVLPGLVFRDFSKALNDSRMKTRVRDREHESALLREQAGQCTEQRSDLGHVHDGHRADGLGEPVLAERQHLVHVRRVEHAVVDRRARGCALAGARDEPRARVEGDDARAERRHAARESPGTARDVQDVVVRRYAQQALGRRFDQDRLELVAVTDAIVPPAGVRIPDSAVLVGVFGEVGIGAHAASPVQEQRFQELRKAVVRARRNDFSAASTSADSGAAVALRRIRGVAL